MLGSIRTTILVAGICALGLALLFVGSDNALAPLFSLIENNADTAVVQIPMENTFEVTDEKQIEKVLGTDPEQLKTVREERPFVEEKNTPAVPLRVRLPSETLYAIASERVVNLFCELPNNEVAIATGVIVHEHGYILTNAHVTNREESRSCLIRRGSPARNFAIAELVFLSPDFSTQSHTRENLARDVAIWKISDVLEKNDVSIFPALSISPANLPTDGSALATFSYPAELLGSQAVITALHLSFSETRVVSHDVYFIESAQSLGSQKGSSGGILMDPYTGEFAGLIFAINDKKTEYVSERTLFSLTPFAINEAIRTTTNMDLQTYLSTLP